MATKRGAGDRAELSACAAAERRRHDGHGGDPRAEAPAGGAGDTQGAGGGEAEGQEVSG